jgi:anti-anti-sigma factor
VIKVENSLYFETETNNTEELSTTTTQLVATDNQGNIRVTGEATIHQAETLREELLATLTTDRESWTLDLGGLTAMDSAGAQLFISFKKSVKAIQVHSCPENIRNYLDRIGLAQYLL